MKIVGFAVLGIVISVVLWMWLASLISFACNQWFIAQESYRKRVDKKVSEMVSEISDYKSVHGAN